ncbi:lipopolysaccharide biosynthesis protein [Mesonia sp.]|uniref:lipopolysaccharide biosynthesis protein n=1 Tax=Mesonia sp. TaxID=1960830 RepID=UPI0017725301|nr:lipopolysaccharide biosynthesis protein [Mesonia sp.]HIB38448.1 lipopolysaccharide biosynthesis protein [Mesonia sp.]
MNKEIGKKTKIGLLWDLSGSFFRQFIAFFISVTLARLLDPKQFGIIGMSLVFVSISQVFVDVGFTSGLVQQKHTKSITYSSVFYINILISFLLSMAIIVSAPFIAEFYEIDKIEKILYFLSIIPPIAALGLVHSAILTKTLNFKSLTIRDIVATLVGGVVGIVAAFSEFGVYSLVFQQIFTVLTGTILLWFSTSWRPKLEFSYRETKSLLRYSSYVFFDQALRQVSNKIDTIFIGKVFSPSILGFYSRAESLRSQVQTYTTNSLRKVIFPTLSALQDDKENFERMFFKTFNIVSGLTIILVGPIYFLSEEIIIILLGEKWRPSIIFFQILLFTTLTSPQIGMMAKAMLAKGYSKLKFNVGIVQRLLKLSPILIGFYFGIIEFSIAVVVSSSLVFFLFAFILDIKFQLSFSKQFWGLLKPMFPFLVVFLLEKFIFDELNNWLLAISFILIHILYIKLISHDSFLFVYNTIKKIYNSKFKK